MTVGDNQLGCRRNFRVGAADSHLLRGTTLFDCPHAFQNEFVAPKLPSRKKYVAVELMRLQMTLFVVFNFKKKNFEKLFHNFLSFFNLLKNIYIF